jgi:FSR family fosmidomycin resistance protein-like MFS transporter
MSNDQNKKFQLGNITLLSVSHLLHDIYSSFLAPLRPLLIEKFGVTLAMASLWDLFQRIPWLLNPIIGMIAERKAARYFVIISPSVTAVSMSLLGVAPSFAVVSILLLVMGISSAFYHVPSPVMIKRLSGNKTGKGMSFYMFGGEMARTLGPLVITGAVTLWGLEGTWKLIPFGLVATFLLYLRLRKIDIVPHKAGSHSLAGFWHTIRKMLPFFIILIGITFFRAIMKSGLTAFLPTYFYMEKGETLWFSNSALAVFQLAGAVGTFFSGTISDKIGRKTALLIISVITPVFMFLFVISSGIWSFLLLVILGLFVFAPGPVMLALVQDVSEDKPVFMNSIYMTISFVSSAISVVFAGLLGDWLGLENTYLLSSLLALGAVPFILMLKKR